MRASILLAFVALAVASGCSGTDSIDPVPTVQNVAGTYTLRDALISGRITNLPITIHGQTIVSGSVTLRANSTFESVLRFESGPPDPDSGTFTLVGDQVTLTFADGVKTPGAVTGSELWLHPETGVMYRLVR